MDSEINTTTDDAPHAANAVSIFSSAGNANEFPVLKAFQEYIDAEQAKARKRMLGLSIFFILLLVVVVVTFTLVMTSVINRNQALSDRLLDIALREKTQAQPVVNVQQPIPQPVIQQPSQADVLKPVLEKFDKLAEAMVKAQQQHVPVAAPAPVVVTTAASPSPAAQVAESAEIARLREELRREIAARKEQEAKAKEEKRKAEIEAHRRRLYPEYYARQAAQKVVPAAATPQTPPSSTKLPGMTPINYFSTDGDDAELAQLLPARKQQPSPKAAPVPLPAPAVKTQRPVPAIPAQKPAKTLSINSGVDGSSIPWLIEQPKK